MIRNYNPKTPEPFLELKLVNKMSPNIFMRLQPHTNQPE